MKYGDEVLANIIVTGSDDQKSHHMKGSIQVNN